MDGKKCQIFPFQLETYFYPACSKKMARIGMHSAYYNRQMVERIVAFIMVLSLSPILFVLSFFIFAKDGWPVLFIQKRVGKNRKIFSLYKLRTMHRNADIKKKELLDKNEADGPVFKMRDDPRFTKFGTFLSHTGLDELPQLVNIIKGDMAFIGPRPFPIEEEKLLKPWMKKREQVSPGIISPAILSGNYHKNFDAWMKSDVDFANKRKKNTFFVFLSAIVFLCKLFAKELRYYLAHKEDQGV